MSNKKILFLGSVFSKNTLVNNPAVNQASHNWSKGFLDALKNKFYKIDCLSFKNEKIWPLGRIIVRADVNDFDDNFNSFPVSYLNFPFLRSFSVTISFFFKLKKLIKKNDYDIIFSYNLYPWHYRIFGLLKKTNSFNIPIILDEDNPIKDNWNSFYKRSINADGLIFLSYWGYKNYPYDKPCYHLDSGFSRWMGRLNFQVNKKPIIVYSGKYQETYGGLSKLADILNSIKIDCKILLTGKANMRLIDKYFSKNPKIKYLGFLNDSDLHEIFLSADLFLNYRPPEIEDNIMIFPSKINHYLSYGKPVISSNTPGLSPDYKNLLFFPEDENIESYHKLIYRILKTDDIDKINLYNKIESWFKKNKTWEILTNRLINWINENFDEKVITKN